MGNMECEWKVDYIDEGFCRIVYRKESRVCFQDDDEVERESRVCFQDEGPYVACYTITNWDEPGSEIKLKPAAYPLFELPTGASELRTKVRDFLTKGVQSAKVEKGPMGQKGETPMGKK